MTNAIDWRSIRESLNWDDISQQRAILRQRAEQYGAPLRHEDTETDGFTVLIFELGGEQYGIDVMLVHAIRTVHKITPVPGVPRFYRGVVNLRGQITTVLDLRIFFNLVSDETPHELVIVKANNLEIGLLADHVHGVVHIPANTIRPIEHIKYARGVTAHRLVLLDIMQMFEDQRLIAGAQDDL